MKSTKPNAQYNIASSKSFVVRVATYQRRRIYERFLHDSGVGNSKSILDVGVTSDRVYESSNYLEAWYPYKKAITAVGVDDASFLADLYPGIKFVRASGLALPFGDRAFDVVHSSAVIEHIGSAKNQNRFIAECARVANRFVFITTPNRWFPIEFHTALPLIHWLPALLFRAALSRTPLKFFAEETNLNLMTAADLWRSSRNVAGFDFKVASMALGGWPSNLLLIGVRKGRLDNTPNLCHFESARRACTGALRPR